MVSLQNDIRYYGLTGAGVGMVASCCTSLTLTQGAFIGAVLNITSIFARKMYRSLNSFAESFKVTDWNVRVKKAIDSLSFGTGLAVGAVALRYLSRTKVSMESTAALGLGFLAICKLAKEFKFKHRLVPLFQKKSSQPKQL